MCGIAAVVDHHGTVDAYRVREMLRRMEHRGDEGASGQVLSIDSAVLGCNRLAIVDRHNGAQPMSGCHGVSVVYNGEIYNHKELREELEARGHTFATAADTEVLVHGFREWGTELLPKLDGIFAFVLVDVPSRRVLAARDALGVKPLYFVREGTEWRFASEIKALVPTTREIETLPPGHFLNDGRTTQYFTIARRSEACDDAEAIHIFRRLLERAVAKQTDTDLPIGVVFSGGLDSAAMLALAAANHPNVTAFTAGFPGSEDVAVARRYCEEAAIPQVVVPLKSEDLIAGLRPTIRQSEQFEPVDVMDASVIGCVFKSVAHQGIKIALTGDGSDELLAGYDLFETHPDPDALMRYRLWNLHRTDLQRVDRMSMAHRVEARVPFLDRELVSFATGLPMRLKRRHGREKWLLRQAVADLLPSYITSRPKARMSEGSGLLNTIIDYTRSLPPPDEDWSFPEGQFVEPETRYFLSEYLKCGYPMPHERWKKVGLDFWPDSYFAQRFKCASRSGQEADEAAPSRPERPSATGRAQAMDGAQALDRSRSD